ncbi:MAG: alpha/beta fold hydrolase [Christensenellaceae bacterium]|jgi:pimeloyl-ACP methyl ester carboxylesterase|nr:alpha/beta fold hydrolase [Christensenellaceae bacterium]
MEPILLQATEQGRGAPLILLHGNGESGAYFAEQIRYFSKSYRVLAVDTRGYGRSPRGTAPFTLTQFAEDLKFFMDYNGIARAILLGFSDGGNIALLFALKYPQYVEKLVLNGANLMPAGMKPHIHAMIALSYAGLTVAALCSKKAVYLKARYALMALEPKIPLTALRALVGIPALVLVGSRDMIRRRHSQSMAAALPQGRLCVLEGDHFIAAKNSEVYNEAVEAFFGE